MISKEREAEKYRALGFQLADVGKCKDAIEAHEKAKKLHEELEDLPGVAGDLTNIAITLEKTGDDAKALKLHEEALKIDEKIDFKPGLRIDYANLVRIHTGKKNLAEAAYFRRKLMEVLEHLRIQALAAQYQTGQLLARITSRKIQDNVLSTLSFSGVYAGEYDAIKSYGGIKSVEKKVSREYCSALRNNYRKDVMRQFAALGEEVFQCLLSADQMKTFGGSILSRELDKDHMRVLVSLSRELAFLPVEVMHTGREFLSLEYPFARTTFGLPLVQRGKLPMKEPISLLLVASNPYPASHKKHIPSGMLDQQIEMISKALKRSERKGQVELTLLHESESSKANVLEEIRSGRHDAFHYVGHAEYRRDIPRESCIELASVVPGKVHRLDAFSLYEYSRKTDLQLVYLNGCSTAEQQETKLLNEDNKILGLSDALIQSGIKYVVGVRWPIDLRSSSVHACEFYSLLSDGKSVEESMMFARKAVGSESNWRRPGWVAPMLFVRD